MEDKEVEMHAKALAPAELSGDGAGDVASGALYRGAIYQEPQPCVSPEFAGAVQELEKKLGLSVWLLVQAGGPHPFHALEEPVWDAFYKEKTRLPKDGIAVLLDSPGGSARVAYGLARLFRSKCRRFVVVLPRYAKSAATILALAADTIIVGERGELGPLDAQLMDPDREEYASTLDEVQALQRLHARALDAVDETMNVLVMRSGKKVETLLPIALRFVSDMMRPLLDKIDTVHYTQMSRVLKVAEEYAIRLLIPRYPKEQAEKIARHLVEGYPEHDFIIDAEEAMSIGLNVERATSEIATILDDIASNINGYTVFGHLEEVPAP